jgi:hypothetical protein
MAFPFLNQHPHIPPMFGLQGQQTFQVPYWQGPEDVLSFWELLDIFFKVRALNPGIKRLDIFYLPELDEAGFVMRYVFLPQFGMLPFPVRMGDGLFYMPPP